MLEAFKNRIRAAWNTLFNSDSEEGLSDAGKEKLIAFLIAVVLAFSLWMIVNLNRDYTLNVEIPVVLGQIATDQALAEELPEQVVASISGEGWSLLNVYQNPPQVYVDISEQEVNLFDQVRRQLSSISNITVQKVNPLTLQLNLEERQSKKVPVTSHVEVNFREQYDFLEKPELHPDSVTVYGATSIIDTIAEWPTVPLQFNRVDKAFTMQVALKNAGSLLTLSEQAITYHADVVEYIGEEVKVPIQIRNTPMDSHITLSPSSMIINYNVPINEYVKLNRQNLFEAYITYAQIMQDTTGFVAPKIQQLLPEAHLKITRLEPSQVSYFTVVED